LGSEDKAAKGALGISRETCEEGEIERRTASNMPPAETFRAVANSRNSLSFSSRFLTKTGIAKGKRGHRLRSAIAVRPFTHTPSGVINPK